LGADQTLIARDIPTPEKPGADHVVIRMDACAINPGDKFFLGRTPPPDLPLSVYDVCGVSGAGIVFAVGEGVPPSYADLLMPGYDGWLVTVLRLAIHGADDVIPHVSIALRQRKPVFVKSALRNINHSTKARLTPSLLERSNPTSTLSKMAGWISFTAGIRA
jgi:hypothetical protein